jgi:hypothetical protein
MNGKSYKNYYLAIKNWVVNAVNERKNKSETTKGTKKDSFYDNLNILEKKYGGAKDE